MFSEFFSYYFYYFIMLYGIIFKQIKYNTYSLQQTKLIQVIKLYFYPWLINIILILYILMWCNSVIPLTFSLISGRLYRYNTIRGMLSSQKSTDFYLPIRIVNHPVERFIYIILWYNIT